MAKALTVKGLENIKPGASRRELPDGLLTGLYLVVQPSGVKSWALRYRVNGVPRKHTLGTYPAIGLVAARELAKAALRGVAEGKDPSRDKLKERALELAGADTVQAVAADFVERWAKKKTRETTWRETQRILNKEVIPAWRRRRIGTVAKADVIALLDRITDRGTPIMANRTLAAVRKMFAWAKGRDLISVSPCDGIKAPGAEQSRDRVLSDDEVRLVWKAAEKLAWPFGNMVQMLMLTGQRRDEVADMTRSELDLDGKLWTMARERSKNDRAHIVPLSGAALKVLADCKIIAGKRGYVFTSTGESPISGFSRAKEQLDAAIAKIRDAELEPGEKLAPVPHWTFHDIRRTVATGMAELKTPIHVVESILNHKSGTIKGVARIYNRYDYQAEKRAALDRWARKLSLIVGNESASNVVSLDGARR